MEEKQQYTSFNSEFQKIEGLVNPVVVNKETNDKTITLEDFEKQIKDKERIDKISTNGIINHFKKIVEKYNLLDFVKMAEANGKDVFIAIMPFISDKKDLEDYHHQLICGKF